MALRSFEILKSLQQSLDLFESSLISAERFISKDYLAILDKKKLTDIKIGDFANREMSAVFINLNDVCHIENSASAREILQLVNYYVNMADNIIQKNNGFINYYVNNTIIALFDRPANNAIYSCLSLLKKLKSINENKIVNLSIGIQTGLLTLGIIGNEDKMNYVILGETIDSAAQILEQNKHYETSILVGQNTIEKLYHHENFSFRWIGYLKNEKTLIYEIFDGDNEEIKQLKKKTKIQFENAVKDYTESRFQESRRNFTEILKLNSQDKVVKKYLTLLEGK